ncbi:phage terminase large subunit [Metasolibacillus sp.]|uniref:phage terminase large subunit n=1 Tax=Metasolibacillus sp. TaxID=2703680 RepID=UPI0025D67A74|nr:phage terminase large subunit [Metasolibacillus sp.]MCT6926154.1 phage terminase large subunit [Metasolibacillus sp.]MCT6942413.1 phage terminase large subunit [Metasolibacillus sp.]
MPTLSKKQISVIAKQAQRELAKRNYHDYVVYAHHGQYKHFRHTELVCDVLQRIAEGEQLSVLIEMPPRHGKSMTVSETFPSFYLAKNPTKRVITAAYSDGLAKKFGRLNRNKFVEFANDLFGIKISESNASIKDWGIQDSDGGMIATGIGGSITGQGADLMIIDDPIKNAKEANSQVIRDSIWDEWESTLSTRLHDGASLIVIMTRWHEDDLIGRLLARSPRKWIRLRLPAIAEDEDDLLGREVGEALCPELGFNEKWAEQKKVEVGSRTWASLYQQRPTPAGGNIFKREWMRYYVRTEQQKREWGLSDDVIVLPIHFDKLAQSWDCAFKDTSTSDPVAGGVWARKKGQYFLLDVNHGRKGFVDTIKAIRAMSDKWPQARSKYVEDKANGSAVIEMLQDEISGIIPVEPDGGKEVRAHAVSPLFEAGNVFLPHPNICSWTEDVIEELVSFPNAAHDDLVDMTTQALNQLYTNNSSLLDRFKRQAGY